MKMKSIFYLGFAVITFSIIGITACKKDNESTANENVQSLLKSYDNSYCDIVDTLLNLNGIPVNIIESGSGTFLGVHQNDNLTTPLVLYTWDSNLCRWYIGGTVWGSCGDGCDIPYYDIRSALTGKHMGISTNNLNSGPLLLSMLGTEHPYWKIKNIPNTDFYTIEHYRASYLRPPSKYLTKNLTQVSVFKQNWIIKPLGTFDMVGLSWFIAPEDVVTSIPEFVQEVTMNNRSSVTQTMSATFAKKATETSSFSQSHGISITVGASIRVGVPIFANGSINTSITTSTTWQYGKIETQEDTRTYSFPLNVPPHTTLFTKAYVQMNKATVSYIATYRERTTGKELKLRGKWEGVQAGSIYYEIIEDGTKRVLQRINGTPNAPVSL